MCKTCHHHKDVTRTCEHVISVSADGISVRLCVCGAHNCLCLSVVACKHTVSPLSALTLAFPNLAQ